jgi:hypothetical protein
MPRDREKEIPMVAPVKTRRLVCTVVRIVEPVESSGPIDRRLGAKPSALLPWADPYIAGLVHRLQREVRSERAGLRATAACERRPAERWMFDDRGACRLLNSSPTAELEPPSPGMDPDWDWWERPQWSVDGEPVE